MVTGASRGIGAAIALLAARTGYAVVVNYSEDASGAEAVARAIKDDGGTAVPTRADVSDPAAVRSLFDAAAQLGTLTAVVNNAGGGRPHHRICGRSGAAGRPGERSGSGEHQHRPACGGRDAGPRGAA